MFDNARNFFDIISTFEHKEASLTTLLKLFNVLADATLHSLHEVVKVTPAICDYNLSSLYHLHCIFVWFLQLARWQQEYAILVALRIGRGFTDRSFKEFSLLRPELHLRLKVIHVLR